MGTAVSFCFTEQQHGKMSCSELNAKTEPEGLGRGGATLKPGIVRYDPNAAFVRVFLGASSLLCVHSAKEPEK